MSSLISGASSFTSILNDPLGIFKPNDLGINIGGGKGIAGKTGGRIWDAWSDPMANYKEDFMPEVELPAITSSVDKTGSKSLVDQAAQSEAYRIRRRAGSASMIKTSGMGVMDTPTTSLKTILG
jgi:hypothetical protein